MVLDFDFKKIAVDCKWVCVSDLPAGRQVGTASFIALRRLADGKKDTVDSTAGYGFFSFKKNHTRQRPKNYYFGSKLERFLLYKKYTATPMIPQTIKAIQV